jgi:hypothetical protein
MPWILPCMPEKMVECTLANPCPPHTTPIPKYPSISVALTTSLTSLCQDVNHEPRHSPHSMPSLFFTKIITKITIICQLGPAHTDIVSELSITCCICGFQELFIKILHLSRNRMPCSERAISKPHIPTKTPVQCLP